MDLSRLYDKQSPYSPDQKLEVVMTFAVTGSMAEAARRTGVPVGTIRQWKNRPAPWWDECLTYCRNVLRDKADGRLTGLMHALADELEDRIRNGDEVVVQGQVFRRKMSGKDCATTFGILHDKRALMRGDATSRSERKDTTGELNKLQREFDRLYGEKFGGRSTFQGEKERERVQEEQRLLPEIKEHTGPESA